MKVMEAVPGYPNLHRRNETYYLYKRVPKGLLEAYNGKPFIRRSLKANDLKEAKVLLYKALVELDEVFAQAEVVLKETVSPQEAQEIANGRLTDLLIEDMEQRQKGDPEGAEVFDAVRQQLLSVGSVTFTTKKEAYAEFGMSDRDCRQQQQTIDQMKPHYRAVNARQNLGAVADDVEFFFEEHHQRLRKGSEGWRCLAREMLNIWVRSETAFFKR